MRKRKRYADADAVCGRGRGSRSGCGLVHGPGCGAGRATTRRAASPPSRAPRARHPPRPVTESDESGTRRATASTVRRRVFAPRSVVRHAHRDENTAHRPVLSDAGHASSALGLLTARTRVDSTTCMTRSDPPRESLSREHEPARLDSVLSRHICSVEHLEIESAHLVAESINPPRTSDASAPDRPSPADPPCGARTARERGSPSRCS